MWCCWVSLQAPIRGKEGGDGNVNGAGLTKCGTWDDMEIYSEKLILTLECHFVCWREQVSVIITLSINNSQLRVHSISLKHFIYHPCDDCSLCHGFNMLLHITIRLEPQIRIFKSLPCLFFLQFSRKCSNRSHTEASRVKLHC